MVYGLIFLGPTKFAAQDQRDGITYFAQENNLNIDKFISFKNSPSMLAFNPGDTIVCYNWACLCEKTQFLRKFIQHLVENAICVYSVTSGYYIDKTMNMQTLLYAFSMYEEIRTSFLSNKAIESAKKRTISGRQLGSRNVKHVLDGKEKTILKMHQDGISMYAIAKKLKVSAPTIKRFLVSQN